MAGGGNGHVGRKHHVIADDNVGIIDQRQVEVRVKIIANGGVGTVGHMNRRLYPALLAHGSEHPLNNVVS